MYGNYRYWRIDDVVFDKDCESFEFEDEKDNLPAAGSAISNGQEGSESSRLEGE